MQIQEIFIGLVALVVVVITLLGPEYGYVFMLMWQDYLTLHRNHGSRFEQREAASDDTVVIDSLTQGSKSDSGLNSSNVIIKLDKEGV